MIQKAFILFIALLCFGCSDRQTAGEFKQKTYLPSVLIDGRFYLKIPTLNGDTIMGLCDTGGGYTALYTSTAERLGLTNSIKSVDIKNEVTRYVHAADIYSNDYIPYPKIRSYYTSYIEEPFFEVPDDNQESRLISEYIPHDAFLGQFFFIDHAWTFDYSTGSMYVHTPLSKDAMHENIQALGFKTDLFGNKKFGHPSMKLEIDGETIDFLFDTGASILLSENGKTKVGAASKSIGGSFIAKSVFEKWQRKHPEWRLIKKGEFTGADLIEVPLVKVGNLSAGPVWFAVRPDEAWSKGMIRSMDKVVKGAVGGSFLQYFTVTIDYNSELIQFEKRDY